MTDDMLGEVPTYLDLEEEILFCHVKAHTAHDTYMLKPPTMNERGLPVVNGALNVLEDISHYWINRRDASVKISKALRGADDIAEFEARMDAYGVNTIIYGGLGKWTSKLQAWRTASPGLFDDGSPFVLPDPPTNS